MSGNQTWFSLSDFMQIERNLQQSLKQLTRLVRLRTTIEFARRIYYDLIVRRSRTHIHTAQQVQLRHPPIFILGLYRSGTTLLRYIIDSHSRICCPPEIDILLPLSTLLDERYVTNLDSIGFEKHHILQQIRSFYVHFLGNYANAHSKARWADKSPSYVDCLDFIRQVFPEAQFLVLYRHPFDQAHSHTKGGKFTPSHLAQYCRSGEPLLVSAVRYWREKTDKLIDFETRYTESCFALRYEDLCMKPEFYLKDLFVFLSEKWEPDVTEFYRFRHEKGREDSRVRGTRGFTASKGNYKSWPSNVLEKSISIAEPTLSQLNYTVDL